MAIDINEIIAKVKDSLGLGDRTIVGLDIGMSSVKVAQIHHLKGGEIILQKYASVGLPEASIIEEDIQKADEISQAIIEALGQARIKAELAAICLTGPNSIAKKLQLAGGPDEELMDQVEWEAEQYLPFAIDDAIISSHKYGENASGGVDILVAAAKEEVIENFKAVVEQTKKLRVKIVDLGLISITNVFEHVMGKQLDENEGSFLIVDFGAQKTDCIIFKKKMITFTKRISIGGSMITEEIQRQMGVNFLQAEDLKITKDKNGNLPEEVLEVIESVLEQFFSEIKKTLDFYITATSDENFVGCWLTGGGAQTMGLKEGLENLLGISVNIFNPFERIQIDNKNINEEDVNTIAHCGVTAIGLAMRTQKK